MSHHHRKAIHNIRRWFPIALFTVYAFGVIVTLSVRAQEPTALSDHMEIESVRRDLDHLSDLPQQASALRERLVVVESVQKQQGHQLDDISSLEKWVVFGVFSILGTPILQRFKFGSESSGSNPSVPTVKGRAAGVE